MKSKVPSVSTTFDENHNAHNDYPTSYSKKKIEESRNNLYKSLDKNTQRRPRISYRISETQVYTDCAECSLGGNGRNKCACGYGVRTINQNGCCNGRLMAKYRL